jgi:hypothetical protein
MCTSTIDGYRQLRTTLNTVITYKDTTMQILPGKVKKLNATDEVGRTGLGV